MMKLSKALSEFSARLGYQFKNAELLERAMTHPSFSTPGRRSNQRLEFLGDRVLGLVMAEALFAADKEAAEGILAPRYNALVRKEMCAEIAREIDLGAVLRLGRSELKTGGRRKDALLGDAMEAVLAAVYLDGGFSAAREVVLRLWGERVHSVNDDARDPKTMLQEWVQARGETPPQYVEVGGTGPEHNRVFTIEVRLQSGDTALASAGAKRSAEMAAAKQMLERLEDDNG